jgi:EAL domain-containing protein (putative c-di-GMP-specific phosphodiesterase class I)
MPFAPTIPALTLEAEPRPPATTAAIVGLATQLATSRTRQQVATRLAVALQRLVPARVVVVSLEGAFACRGIGDDAARTAARHLRASDELWSSLVAQLPVAISGGARHDARRVLSALAGDHDHDHAHGEHVGLALAIGIDDGDDTGFVLVAGDSLDPSTDDEVLAAVGCLGSATLAHLDRATRLADAAATDPASGFLTVAGLTARVDALVADGRHPSLVTVELDGLAPLAAGFGAAAAAAVVRDVGARVADIPGVLAIAALAPDRIAVLATGDPGAIGDQVVARAAEAVRVGRHHLALGARAGAAGPASDARTLLDLAELARAVAAATGQTIVVHTRDLAEACHRRLALVADLWRALEQDELVVHYQPQVDARGRTVAVEALVRWRRADGTTVAPDDFLPVAESAGMMADVDLHVLAQACHQLASWDDGRRVAVNLSASTLARPGIGERILDTIAAAGVDRRRVELEITETAAAAEAGWTETLARFRSAGLTIALDDFGTGYSSLGRIHRLPLDRLKIDRSFVADLDGAGAAVVRAVVALGRELGLRVLAEGVEDQATADSLLALGCDELQGYHFGAPMPAPA